MGGEHVRSNLSSASTVVVIASLLAVALLPAAASGHTSGGEQISSCSAIIVVPCTTGQHQIEGTELRLGFSWSTDTHVTVENRIQWTGGSLVLTCELDGPSYDCNLSGSAPAPGTTVYHLCRQTSLSIGGSWTCLFEHDAGGSADASASAGAPTVAHAVTVPLAT